MEFGLGVLLALIAVAVTVTPGINNGLVAATAWLMTVLYGFWLVERHREEVFAFIRDNPRWTTVSVAALAALVVGGLWANYVLPRVREGAQPVEEPSNESAPRRPLPLGADRIRPAVLGLVHEMEQVGGKEFREEAAGMLMNGERLSFEHQPQSLFALTPNAGFTVVPSLRPVTSAMATLEAMLIEPTNIGSFIDRDGSKVSGRQVLNGYGAVFLEYQNLLSMPWVLNAHKYSDDGAVVDPDTRFHIVLFGMRQVSKEMLNRFIKAVDDADGQFIRP